MARRALPAPPPLSPLTGGRRSRRGTTVVPAGVLLGLVTVASAAGALVLLV